MIRVALLVAAAAVALPGALAALHLSVLSLASLFYREPRPVGPVPEVRFLVLVPAHDEERVIGATLDALGASLRPRDTLLVVADRCTDATASIARAHGALVLERGPAEEPGRAAARQAGLEHARDLGWDAVLMVDADSIVEPGFLDRCEETLATGADALQARSEAALGSGLVAQASLAAFVLQGVTVPRGRDRLRCSVRLRGTGMVLRRPVVERHRFRAPASEDLWYGLDLCLEGVLPRHVDSARLRSANVGTWRAASTQKLRYEAGRMSAAREFLVPLLRRRSRAALEAAWFLATPPFATAAASLLAGLALAAAARSWAASAVMGALLLSLGVDLVVGLVAARAPARTYLALLAAPWYLAWKVPVQLRALLSARRGDTYYPPTSRDDLPGPGGSAPDVPSPSS